MWNAALRFWQGFGLGVHSICMSYLLAFLPLPGLQTRNGTTSSTSDSSLLRCPACGGGMIIRSRNSTPEPTRYWAHCPHCGVVSLGIASHQTPSGNSKLPY